ncbi:hypothetical protein [Ralstonia sp. 1B3]|uniref:hypothetical protein n=1 Tax=Ralstonia sp. 1B3 TaxID=2997421 RepID=UPI002FCC41B1
MSIQTQDWVTLVRNQVAAIQGYAKVLVDLTVGSVLRAVVEANAAVTVWLQGLILQVLAITRAATSSGSDLDTWMADFGLTRLAAVPATGSVTFSRFTVTQQWWCRSRLWYRRATARSSSTWWSIRPTLPTAPRWAAM